MDIRKAGPRDVSERPTLVTCTHKELVGSRQRVVSSELTSLHVSSRLVTGRSRPLCLRPVVPVPGGQDPPSPPVRYFLIPGGPSGGGTRGGVDTTIPTPPPPVSPPCHRTLVEDDIDLLRSRNRGRPSLPLSLTDNPR